MAVLDESGVGEFVLKDHVFKNILSYVDHGKSPGVPALYEFANNGEYLKYHWQDLKREMEERLLALYKSVDGVFAPRDDVNGGVAKAISNVSNNLCDPVRIFGKDEPHLLSKQYQRIICSVSLLDALIEVLCIIEQNNAEIGSYHDIPSQAGIDLYTDKENTSFYETCDKADRVKPLASNDAKRWDYTFQDWQYDAEYAQRAILNGSVLKVEGKFVANPRCVWWLKVTRARFNCMKNSLYMTTDGRLYAAKRAGRMLSGSRGTASINSRQRAYLAWIVFDLEQFTKTMGDDCIEEWQRDAVEEYEKWGFTITDYQKCNGKFDFCSHMFEDGKAVPTAYEKMLYNFLRGDRDFDKLLQLKFLLRNHPVLESLSERLEDFLNPISNA